MRVTDREAAETLALSALSFLARDPDRIAAFLSQTGIGPDQIRDAAGQPGFLAGVLDHLLGDESLLLMFADDCGIEPGAVAAARAGLGGRQPPFQS